MEQAAKPPMETYSKETTIDIQWFLKKSAVFLINISWI